MPGNELYIRNKAHQQDFSVAIDFLKQYTGSEATFRAYRREIERLLQWSWLIAERSIKELTRSDIEKYLSFCQKPKKSWIGTKTVSRFITDKDDNRIPNPAWRLFVARVSKADFKYGIKANVQHYHLSEKSLREIFTVTSSFYTHLVNENIVDKNPVMLIRQKNKYFSKRQGGTKIMRLSQQQWLHCIKVAEQLAKKTPERHERTLFIMTILYQLYLRISELSVRGDWTPRMGNFYKDSQGHWWFTTVGKGNKERSITVSDEMLAALRRYREHLGLTALPLINEKTPLITKIRGEGAITSDREIRKIVQVCFDQAVTQLRNKNLVDAADELEHATVHWLRHTGISDDINLRKRPGSHVRDDAGHDSSLTTDRYNDVTLQERHQSAKNKKTKET